MLKAKKYDWKDSNLALFGSDTEKQVKKESAESEPAWQGAGQKPGLQIWRIVKFKVTHQRKEDYGKFFDGDSYIVLNTYKEEGGDELLHDVHFWIGKNSTQDEYGTAAYKTVELDTFLDDKPIQHREVQGFESSLFKSYFKELTIMKGGADTGFRHVTPTEYKPRLFHFRGDKTKVTSRQIPMNSELDDNDVYVLDNGLQLYQWNGSQANKDEKWQTGKWVAALKSERNGKPSVDVIDRVEDDDSEMKELMANNMDDDDEADPPGYERQEAKLWKISDAGGSLDMSFVKEGVVSSSDLQSEDVFLIDLNDSVYTWVGRRASTNEKKNALSYAHNYLKDKENANASISCVQQGKETRQFQQDVFAQAA